MGQYNLDRFFKPKRIAIIDQDDNSGTISQTILTNLIKSRYDGVVYPVHPELPEILEKKTCQSIAELESSIDLAIITASIETIPEILSVCVDRKIAGAIIVSDLGQPKRAKNTQFIEAIRQQAYDGGLRLLGPGCLGFIRPGIHLNAGLAKDMPHNGDLAFVSQSSAVSMAVLNLALRESFGFSHFVDIGHMVDIDFGDMLDYLGNDYHTKSILLYMENLIHVRKFMSAARAVSRIKPILILKVNRFDERFNDEEPTAFSRQPFEDCIYSAAFKRAGIIQVETLEALFDSAELAAKRPRFPGARLAIMSTGRGPGVMALDALQKRKGTPAVLSPTSLANLKIKDNTNDSFSFPLNIGHKASPDRFRKMLEILLEDSRTDAVLVIVAPLGEVDPWGYAEKIVTVAKSQKKPIIVCLMGGNRVASAMDLLNQAGFPTFETPERAVRAFLHMAGYARNLEVLRQVPPRLSRQVIVDGDKAGKLIAQAPAGGKLSDSESLAILEAYGYTIKKAGNTGGSSSIHQVVLLNLGATRDTLFGPIIYLRLGGNYAASFQKAAVSLLPMNRLLARRMIEKADLTPIIKGNNGHLLIDPGTLESTIIQLSQLMIDFPDISRTDINPLEIHNGKIVTQNARITVSPFKSTSSPHLVISAYPIEYESITTVKDNLRIFVRPVRPEDAPLFRELFDDLSPTSIYYRFFSPMKRLSPTMLARFTQIDYDRDIALVALDGDADSRDKMYGVARIIGDADSIAGEFAVLVGDPWHGKGIGAFLLQKCLDIAKSRGFRKVMGFVLQQNRGMLALGKKLGFSVKKSAEGGEYELTIRW